MDSEELPDDCTKWPSDPFAVLRVTRGAADSEIKRAYNRLLRRFKPERFPDQFQKLRECYEACLSQSPWYRFDTGDETAAPEVSDPVVQERPADPANNYWKAAIEGRMAEAYSGLVEMHRSLPERRDLPLRLYWLLAVDPDLDTVRTRHDWLYAGLQLAELGGTAVELYRRELDADPAGMLTGVFERLLALPAGSNALQTLASMRITAAARHPLRDALLADLRLLASRRAELGEVAWLSLLTQTIGWAVWAHWPVIDDFIRGELKTLKYLQLPQSYFFDRIDESVAIAGTLDFLQLNPPLGNLIEMLRVGWASQDEPDAREVEIAARSIAEAMELALSKLIQLGEQHGIGLLVRVERIFSSYLRQFEEPEREEIPAEFIRGVARKMVGWLSISRYFQTMPMVIRALAEEGIEPEELASAMETDNRLIGVEYAQRMRGDIVFRIGWLAVRIAHG